MTRVSILWLLMICCAITDAMEKPKEEVKPLSSPQQEDKRAKIMLDLADTYYYGFGTIQKDVSKAIDLYSKIVRSTQDPIIKFIAWYMLILAGGAKLIFNLREQMDIEKEILDNASPEFYQSIKERAALYQRFLKIVGLSEEQVSLHPYAKTFLQLLEGKVARESINCFILHTLYIHLTTLSVDQEAVANAEFFLHELEQRDQRGQGQGLEILKNLLQRSGYSQNLVRIYDELVQFIWFAYLGKQLVRLSLGRVYYWGRITDGMRDYAKARAYFEEVMQHAENDVVKTVVEAAMSLSDIYFLGKGLENPDYEKARQYAEYVYQHSEEFPDMAVNALIRLGDIYARGLSIKRDRAQAEKYFLEALDILNENQAECVQPAGGWSMPLGMIKQYALIYFALGWLYKHGGDEVSKDFYRAKTWYIKLLDLDYVPEYLRWYALMDLGDIYAIGNEHIERNISLARAYWEQVAAQNKYLNLKKRASDKLVTSSMFMVD